MARSARQSTCWKTIIIPSHPLPRTWLSLVWRHHINKAVRWAAAAAAVACATAPERWPRGTATFLATFAPVFRSSLRAIQASKFCGCRLHRPRRSCCCCCCRRRCRKLNRLDVVVGYASDESIPQLVAMSLRRPTMDSYDYEEYDGEGSLFTATGARSRSTRSS